MRGALAESRQDGLKQYLSSHSPRRQPASSASSLRRGGCTPICASPSTTTRSSTLSFGRTTPRRRLRTRRRVTAAGGAHGLGPGRRRLWRRRHTRRRRSGRDETREVGAMRESEAGGAGVRGGGWPPRQAPEAVPDATPRESAPCPVTDAAATPARAQPGTVPLVGAKKGAEAAVDPRRG